VYVSIDLYKTVLVYPKMYMNVCSYVCVQLCMCAFIYLFVVYI
jgi:hypothetical protein